MSAFNHIALNCRDVPMQEEFYSKHLGFKRSRTFNGGQPNEFILIKLGSVRLELHPTDSAKTAKTAKAGAGEQPLGFKHLAFDVPALEPFLESLRQDGVAHDPIIALPQVAPDARVVFFRDLEGNIIELMEGYLDEEEPQKGRTGEI